MKLQLIKEIDIDGIIWWKISVDGLVKQASAYEDTIKKAFKKYKENLKLGYPKEEVIQEEII